MIQKDLNILTLSLWTVKQVENPMPLAACRGEAGFGANPKEA
jgi:hypothetical protein